MLHGLVQVGLGLVASDIERAAHLAQLPIQVYSHLLALLSEDLVLHGFELVIDDAELFDALALVSQD